MELRTIKSAPGGVWKSVEIPKWDSPTTLVVVFGASKFADESAPLLELASQFPSSTVAGCSTSGEIFETEIHDDTIVAAIVRFKKTRLRAACEAVASSDDSFSAGASLARRLSDPALRAVLVLSDGLNVNGSELIRGLNEGVSESVVVTGGLAGDGDRFERTWVLQGGAPRAKCVAAVGLYGDAVRVGHGSRGGWDIFGPERLVTRSRGNVLFELDGKPALDLYRQYLGDRASGLPATGLLFPLSLRSDAASEKRLVRTILGVGKDEKSLTFAGDIPEGQLAQFMKANFDRLVEGAEGAGRLAASHGVPAPILSIAVSCVGRRLVLGERTEEETEAALEALPPGTRQVGFYSYGEISPHSTGRCDLHNQTMTLTTVGEV